MTGSTSLYLIVSNLYFYLIKFRSKITFTMSMYTTIKFSWTYNGK